MIYFTAHTFKCVCHSIRTMFRVLGIYNFALKLKVQYSNKMRETQNEHMNLFRVHSTFRFSFFSQSDQKRKNQLSFSCKMRILQDNKHHQVDHKM